MTIKNLIFWLKDLRSCLKKILPLYKNTSKAYKKKRLKKKAVLKKLL
jgi:hypothetical protein